MLVTRRDYKSETSVIKTERAIKKVKDLFQRRFRESMNLERVSAPLFVVSGSGINDDLNGTERPVKFDVTDVGCDVEIVHSLAKWKRLSLQDYGFGVGEGLYTDMNAIRRDEECDNLHSVYVDQWDWERIITAEDRNCDYLKKTVSCIVSAIADTKDEIMREYPELKYPVSRDVFFITAQELEDAYPELSPKEREYEITKKHGTVFLMQIGGKLKSGIKHDGRAPDYDDWQLNGDILFWDEVLGMQIELSSMGIRVDADSLLSQLEASGANERLKYDYHKRIVSGELPLTIGGGIGQSRLCMFILEKIHIGEVQSSVWSSEMLEECKKAGIKLL